MAGGSGGGGGIGEEYPTTLLLYGHIIAPHWWSTKDHPVEALLLQDSLLPFVVIPALYMTKRHVKSQTGNVALSHLKKESAGT